MVERRRILSHYNADQRNLFSRAGRDYLVKIKLSAADRFTVDLLCEELDQHSDRLKRVDKQLKTFAKQAPVAEREAREILDSMPCVGPVTIDVVLAEAGDIRRFGSQRKATAYAGLVPGIRESAGKAIGYHQGRFEVVANDLGQNRLAIGPQNEALE